MASRDLDVRGRGALRVAGAVVDVKADLVLSDQLSAQAGRDLYKYARDGNRVVVPAIVSGPLAAPSVSLDVGAAANRAFRNVLESELDKALKRMLKK